MMRSQADVCRYLVCLQITLWVYLSVIIKHIGSLLCLLMLEAVLLLPFNVVHIVQSVSIFYQLMKRECDRPLLTAGTRVSTKAWKHLLRQLDTELNHMGNVPVWCPFLQFLSQNDVPSCNICPILLLQMILLTLSQLYCVHMSRGIFNISLLAKVGSCTKRA